MRRHQQSSGSHRVALRVVPQDVVRVGVVADPASLPDQRPLVALVPLKGRVEEVAQGAGVLGEQRRRQVEPVARPTQAGRVLGLTC